MPSRKDTLRAAAACALLAWAGWLHAAEGVTAQQVLVGQSITLQGGKNAYGAAVMDGVRTYLDKINAQGGVHGRQVALRTLDDDSQAAKAEANARQLVEKDQVFVLFGSVEGGPSTAAMRVAVSASSALSPICVAASGGCWAFSHWTTSAWPRGNWATAAWAAFQSPGWTTMTAPTGTSSGSTWVSCPFCSMLA